MKGRALFLAGAAAILPAAVAASAEAPPHSLPNAQFAPPRTPLLLTRTIWRTLHDGKSIVSHRRYRVRIVAHGDGFQVNGELIDCQVEAPPQLAALAALERARPDGTLFPAYLDGNGRMLDQAGAGPGPGKLSLQGAREARRLVNQSAVSDPGKTQITTYIDQIVNGAGTSAWPSDLFNPARSETREQRRIALPDGSSGVIAVTLAAHGWSPGRLPSLVERTVVTELDGTQKVSREQWTIEVSVR